MALFGRRKQSERSEQSEGPRVGGCDQHGPCRALAAIPAAELPSRLGTIITAADPTLGPDPVMLPFGDGLGFVLCVKGRRGGDGVTDMLIVPEHQAVQWGVERQQLWSWAWVNLDREPLNRQAFPAANGDVLYAVNGMGWPGAAHITRLEKALDTDLPHGALVTMPIGNGLCALPIRSSASLQGIPFLLQLTGQLRTDPNGPFGNGLYWYIGGELENLNARPDGGNDANLRVSGRFKAMMESLPAAPPPQGPRS